MGLTVIPTNIGGVSINSALSPLAALLSSSSTTNFTFPSDLGSNPSMGHAVVFQAYERTSTLATTVSTQAESIVADFEKAFSGPVTATSLWDATTSIASSGFGIAKALAQAPQYKTVADKGNILSTISLFMPENVSVNYNSQYSEVSMTQELGLIGLVGNALTDVNKQQLKKTVTPYAVAGLSQLVESFGSAVGLGQNVGPMAAQAANIFINPQMQLLYRGINLREFQLEFVLTPRSSDEAATIKNLCDKFIEHSLPSTGGAQGGKSGQFLKPPRLFSVQFKFLGQNGVIGNISNVFSSALTNSGLGFLSSSQNISNANAAKLFTVKDCVLENVSVDYTPNGWATYNDGYPVQTHLSLQFKETEMLTRETFNSVDYTNTPTTGA